MAKKNSKKSESSKKEINFEHLSKKIADAEEKSKVDNIAPSIASAYLDNAKYTDDKGIVQYKKKFSVNEREKIADDIFDQLLYHAHRRYFKIDDEKFQDLKKITGPHGEKYIDIIAQYHFGIDREGLKNEYRKHEEIDLNLVQKSLEGSIKQHVSRILGKVTSDVGPEHMGDLKSAIEKLVDKHKLPKKKFKHIQDTYDFKDLMNEYINLVKQNYSEEEKKEE